MNNNNNTPLEIVQKEVRQSVTLDNQDQKILGVLHLPAKFTGKIPAILFCHGLAGNKVGKHRVYVALAKKLAERGIAVLRLDFRGAGDSEGNFEDMTVESQVSDAVQGLKWLSSQEYIDKSRIGIFGRSFGGAIAIIAAQQFQNIKSIGLWAPIFDGHQWRENWKALLQNQLTEQQKHDIMTFDGQTGGMELFEQLFSISMNKYMEEIKDVPLLHIHGEKDGVITLRHAENYKKERSQALDRSKFIRLPESDHDFTYKPEQSLAIDETVDWFKNTLDVKDDE